MAVEAVEEVDDHLLHLLQLLHLAQEEAVMLLHLTQVKRLKASGHFGVRAKLIHQQYLIHPQPSLVEVEVPSQVKKIKRRISFKQLLHRNNK